MNRLPHNGQQDKQVGGIYLASVTAARRRAAEGGGDTFAAALGYFRRMVKVLIRKSA